MNEEIKTKFIKTFADTSIIEEKSYHYPNDNDNKKIVPSIKHVKNEQFCYSIVNNNMIVFNSKLLFEVFNLSFIVQNNRITNKLTPEQREYVQKLVDDHLTTDTKLKVMGI